MTIEISGCEKAVAGSFSSQARSGRRASPRHSGRSGCGLRREADWAWFFRSEAKDPTAPVGATARMGRRVSVVAGRLEGFARWGDPSFLRMTFCRMFARERWRRAPKTPTPIGRERPSYSCPCLRGKRAQRVLSLRMTGRESRDHITFGAHSAIRSGCSYRGLWRLKIGIRLFQIELLDPDIAVADVVTFALEL